MVNFSFLSPFCFIGIMLIVGAVELYRDKCPERHPGRLRSNSYDTNLFFLSILHWCCIDYIMYADEYSLMIACFVLVYEAFDLDSWLCNRLQLATNTTKISWLDVYTCCCCMSVLCLHCNCIVLLVIKASVAIYVCVCVCVL